MALVTGFMRVAAFNLVLVLVLLIEAIRAVSRCETNLEQTARTDQAHTATEPSPKLPFSGLLCSAFVISLDTDSQESER
jgi:hypothetical protein